MRLTRMLAVSAVAALALTGAACSGKKDNGGTDAPKPVDNVKYSTSFGTFGREAYVYAAMEKGYFREENIEVTVAPGEGTGAVLTKMAGGAIDFAPVDSTGFLLQVGQGKVKDITAIAAVHQRSLAGIMTLEGRGISSPKDLEGKSVGETQGGTNGLMFPMYAKLAGVDAAKVKFVNIPAPQLPANLASGTVDAIGQFVVGKPTIEKAAQGKKAVLLPYSDYLTDLYGNVIVTPAKIAKDKPDLVRRFNKALLKGLSWAVDNPAEAGKILVKYQPTQNADAAAAELTLMAAYVRSSGGTGSAVGAMDSQRVARCIAILQGANVIPPGMTPEQVVSFDLTPKV